MIRYISLLAIVWAANAQNGHLDLDSIYESFNSRNNSIENLKCSSIVPIDGGTLQGCYECYTCDHPRFLMHQERTTTTRELVVNVDCKPLRVCCVNQREVTSIRSQENCGKANPEGEPRRVRPTLRSVLPGQYPWRAWIYDGDEKLCAASYIHYSPDVVATTATCMKYAMASGNPVVKVERDELTHTTEIVSVQFHPNYDLQNSYLNDIALLKLVRASGKSRPACRPEALPTIGITCVAVSEDDIAIYAIIPPQKACSNTEGTMCASTPRNDFIAETTSGLFCLDESADKYFLHGIILNHVNQSITYLQISHYEDWITSTINYMRSN